MLTVHLLWLRIKLRESEPVTNGLMLHLSIVLHALWPASSSTASPLCPLLAALSNIPRFALCNVPAHCLAPRCPLSQTGMAEWARCQLRKLKCQEGWQCGGLTNRPCHVGPGGWAERERLCGGMPSGKHWPARRHCQKDLTIEQDAGQHYSVLTFPSLQVCSWWAAPSSTRWRVRTGCWIKMPSSATPTSWRGLPSRWRWSADSSTSSWGSENEPSLHPSVPSNPLLNCKCHQSPSEVEVLMPEYQWPMEPPSQYTQITARGGNTKNQHANQHKNQYCLS